MISPEYVELVQTGLIWYYNRYYNMFRRAIVLFTTTTPHWIQSINPNSLHNKGSCWILMDFYCSVTMLREFGLMVLPDEDPIAIDTPKQK